MTESHTEAANPRRRRLDLAIPANVMVETMPLLTLNTADIRLIGDLVDARLP